MIGVVGVDCLFEKLIMPVLLADDRTQTQDKVRSLAGTDKSPGPANESPGLGRRRPGL